MAKPQLRKPKKKVSPVKTIKVGAIDYKDTATLRKFISGPRQDPRPARHRRLRPGPAQDRQGRQERP